jgi:hypothetical protein
MNTSKILFDLAYTSDKILEQNLIDTNQCVKTINISSDELIYPTIWLYWENKNDSDEPELIKKCKKNFNKNKNVIILDNHTIHKYVSNIVDCSRIKYIAQKVDYYRAKLLYEQGGIWLDIDSIILEDLSYLYEELINTKHEMMGNYDNINKECNVVYLIFKKKSIIAKKWYEFCEKKIISNEYLKWSSLGGHALGYIISENNLQNLVMQFPKNIIFSFGYSNYDKYYSTDLHIIHKTLDIIKKDIKLIILYGTVMYTKSIPEECILSKLFDLEYKK